MVGREELEKLVLNLLETGVEKTTAQLVEEFRIEYPRQWRELEREGERLFGAGCGAFQQPSTRIAQALFDLPGEKRLCRRRDGEYWWSGAPRQSIPGSKRPGRSR